MKIITSTDMLHPILKKYVDEINDLIIIHDIPMKLFETGRTKERHTTLMNKGKEFSVISPHFFDLKSDPPLYASAISYVYYDKKWSWNLRDNTIAAWYNLFGNIVMDKCNGILWGGYLRKNMNVNLFLLKQTTIKNNLKKYPCILI